MEPIIAAGFGVAVFLLVVLILPKFVQPDASKRTRKIIDKIAAGGSSMNADVENTPIPKDDEQVVSSFKAEARGLSKLLINLPKAEELYLLIIKAGYADRIQTVLLGMVVLFVGFSATMMTAAASPLIKIIAIPLSLMLAYIIPKKFFLHKIYKRNLAFIDMFPEAIDMIVRSVKSGHPLNTALRMIADNMEAPIGPEFRQVTNEIAYGRPLVEALRRLAKRIEEQDINFFVVVLSVQQETGGNLAEILTNLSNVIRGRKRLMQKIRALTSEARATAWVLGALPIFQFLAIKFTSPEYLEPLFVTTKGNIVLAGAFGLIALAMWIVSQMIKIDI
jgi:tight adherence protein B